MAQRFSATTQLAEACTSIGFRGDIGYQTFLYSNEVELRRLLMWLIERLPKDETDKGTTALPQQGTAVLEQDIARNIREQLKRPWLMEVQLANKQMKTFLPSTLRIPDVKNMEDAQIGKVLSVIKTFDLTILIFRISSKISTSNLPATNSTAPITNSYSRLRAPPISNVLQKHQETNI